MPKEFFSLTLALHIDISLIKAFMHSFSQNPFKLTVRLLASFSVKIKVLRQPWLSILFGCESQQHASKALFHVIVNALMLLYQVGHSKTYWTYTSDLHWQHLICL